MYDFLREMADSWGLLFLFLVFVGVILWAFRPGSSALHRDIAEIPLRNDEIGDE
jgi:cytochrome c oxidase cbb3-type subunit 4